MRIGATSPFEASLGVAVVIPLPVSQMGWRMIDREAVMTTVTTAGSDRHRHSP
jgi:hypothetical protein